MFKAMGTSHRTAYAYLRQAYLSFRDASIIEQTLFVGLAFVLAWKGKVLAGTFVIDHASLIVMPYFITYFIFNRRGLNYWVSRLSLWVEDIERDLMSKSWYALAAVIGWLNRKTKSFIFKLELWTFPLTFLMMWTLGMMPYFNWIYPPDVYFGIFSESVVGVTGNDFMWNGFLLGFNELRVVPVDLLPTYRYAIFNIYAVLYWLSFIPVFVYGVSQGRTTAFERFHWRHPYLWKERAKIIAIGIGAIIFDLAMIRFLVWLVI